MPTARVGLIWPMTRGAGVSLVVCADATDPSAEEIQNSRVSSGTIQAGTTPVFAENDVFGQPIVAGGGGFCGPAQPRYHSHCRLSPGF